MRILRFITAAGGIVLIAASLLLSACGSLVAQPPTIPYVPTLTPSPYWTETPALAAFITSTPPTPTASPTITLTSPYTSTPPLGPTSTYSVVELTSGPGPTLPAPVIAYFTAFPTEVGPNETVLLFWSATAGISASITRINQDGRPGTSWQVPIEGSLTVTPRVAGGTEQYVLRVTNGIRTVDKWVLITVTCPLTWFFTPAPEDACPESPPNIQAATVQEFERGRMFWLAATDEILVLFNDAPQSAGTDRPAWIIMVDPFVDGSPEDDPSIVPPEGLRQPRRGFGVVWRTTPEVRDRIGWAVGEEVPYNMTYQRERAEEPRWYFTDPARQAIMLQPNGAGWLIVGVQPGE